MQREQRHRAHAVDERASRAVAQHASQQQQQQHSHSGQQQLVPHRRHQDVRFGQETRANRYQARAQGGQNTRRHHDLFHRLLAAFLPHANPLLNMQRLLFVSAARAIPSCHHSHLVRLLELASQPGYLHHLLA